MTYDPVARWLAGIGTGVLLLILVWSIIISLRGPSLAERIDHIEAHLEFQTCLILVDVELRDPAAVASCVPPADDSAD